MTSTRNLITDVAGLRVGNAHDAALASGVGIAEAPARVALDEASRWRLAEAYHDRNVSAAFRELEWE